MANTFWQKVKQRPLLLIGCLVGVLLIVFLVGRQSNNWFWLIILLCPLLHLLLMKDHGSHPLPPQRSRAEVAKFQCPVCKLWYAEKEWAERCQAWCLEHQSCNLEITKHAIKS